MTLLSELKFIIEDMGHARRERWQAMVRHEEFPATYQALLKNTYFYIRESVPLMDDALARLKACQSGNRLIMSFLQHHVEEEFGHEQWVLEDLAHLGVTVADLNDYIPVASVLKLVGAQYYLQSKVSAFTIFGYMSVLEMTPPKASFLKELANKHSIPLSSMSTFLRHADEDVEHGAELQVALDRLTLTKYEHEAVVMAAQVAAANLRDFFDELYKQAFSRDAPALLKA